MEPLVPSGRTVLSAEEQKGIPPKLLDFTCDMGTIYVYERVLKKKLAEWSPIDSEGNIDIDAIADLLYSGLYNIDSPGQSPTKGEILRMVPIGAAGKLAEMMAKVMNESTGIPGEDEIQNPNPEGP